MTVVARLVCYNGRVQGVGFRRKTHQLAQSYPVCGYVKNLDNGEVELWVEGDSEAVEAFLDSLAQRMQSYITDVRLAERDPEGYKDFSIAYDDE